MITLLTIELENELRKISFTRMSMNEYLTTDLNELMFINTDFSKCGNVEDCFICCLYLLLNIRL